jgi:hypothetical protein
MKTENVDPNRPIERNDREEPILMQFSIDIVEPKRATLIKENVEARRENLRTARDEPKRTKSINDNDAPN